MLLVLNTCETIRLLFIPSQAPHVLFVKVLGLEACFGIVYIYDNLLLFSLWINWHLLQQVYRVVNNKYMYLSELRLSGSIFTKEIYVFHS